MSDNVEIILRSVAYDTDRKRYFPRQSQMVRHTHGINYKLTKFLLNKDDLQGKRITHVGIELDLESLKKSKREQPPMPNLSPKP